ncbi:MAG: polyphosphate polymerase domain-containing protein [Muribaculaceae bacterium]|nr:polyphosphate polymerase domain-containing protein [Muribaculaceae bacterium]MBQ3730976.1 polyphosphate polymerase domain-containing protein [Muribaculaceae bacterium]MBQ7205297.1 polyphosphate polymerase domain-containing protein [Muribaculaceae bacterium]
MDRILSTYQPIMLDEMSGIKLMNRTDTKFVTTVDRLRLLLMMAHDDYRAQEIDGKRQALYYTAYFDTPDNNMYIVHQNGHAGRQKLRIRSYVDTGQNFLEVKTKNNRGRTKKKRVDMVGFDPLHPDHGIRFLRQDDQYVSYDNFLRKHLRYDPTILTEQMENHFHRITLVNKAKTERLTIDTDLCFHNLKTGNDVDLTGLVIIELKRDGLQPSPILGMLRDLRIKPSGFSKYCMGSALTNPDLKRNNFKERLRLVERLLARAQQ